MNLPEIEEKLKIKRFNEPIILDSCTTITNVNKFIKSHLTILKANSGKETFKPYYDRLKKLLEL